MPNLFNTKDTKKVYDTSKYISENQIVIWANNGKPHKDGIYLHYNKENDKYESFLKIPVLDENGNEINSSQSAIAKFSFTPLYCFLAFDIFTKYDWEIMDFNKTKAVELKELLAKIEAL